MDSVPAVKALEVRFEQYHAILLDLDILVFRLGAVCAESNLALYRLKFFLDVFYRDGTQLVGSVVPVYDLSPIGRRTVAAALVEHDGIRIPCLPARADEERSIGAHDHDVAVAFQPGHERGLGHGSNQVAASGSLRDGILAEIDLRIAAVIFIVGGIAVKETTGRGVHVRIDDLIAEALRFDVRDEVHFRVFLFDRLVDQDIAFVVVPAAVLVPDFHVFEVERSRMSVLRAFSAPFCCDVAVGIFDGVQSILHERPHLIHRDDIHGISAVACFMAHAAVNDEHRFGMEVFAHLEVFVVAEAVRAVVAPVVVVLVDAFLHRPNGVFPDGAMLNAATFHEATAGEAHKRGFHRDKTFHQIRTQTVLAAFPGFLREERYHVEIELGRGIRGNLQDGLTRGLVRGKGNRILFPCVSVNGDGSGSKC